MKKKIVFIIIFLIGMLIFLGEASDVLAVCSSCSGGDDDGCTSKDYTYMILPIRMKED